MAVLLDIPKLAARELDRRAAYRAVDSLAAFTRFLWPEIEPGTPLTWNWHLDVIASELEAVTRGETRELVICVPPGTMKSILVSVMWPSWEWLKAPHVRSLHISNSDRLGVRDSRRMRDIVQSDRYRQCVDAAGGDDWTLSHDQAEKVHFANTEHGSRLAIPTSARVTGDRADKLVIDDPIDAQEAVIGTPDQVAKRMEEVQHKYDHVWASRLNDKRTNPRVVIMQRLAPGDLAGVLLARGVRSVVLPMEYDPDHPFKYPGDRRTERGELLFPERFPQSLVDEIKSTPGASRHYMAQYQQAPPPLGGGVFRKGWFRYYADEPSAYVLTRGHGDTRRVLKEDCWRVMVADTALSEKSMADFTVVQVWDVIGNDPRAKADDTNHLRSVAILVDQWRGQVSAPEVEDQIERMRRRWKPLFVAIEDTTASKAIIDRLERPMPGERAGIYIKRLKPTEMGGDKVNRAHAASLWMEGGRVFFPESAPWLGDYEAELLNFPGAKDDQVDATAYAILLAEDRNSWIAPEKKPLPPDSLGRILGHDQLLNDTPDQPRRAFALDAEREEGRFNSW